MAPAQAWRSDLKERGLRRVSARDCPERHTLREMMSSNPSSSNKAFLAKSQFLATSTPPLAFRNYLVCTSQNHGLDCNGHPRRPSHNFCSAVCLGVGT